MASYNYLAQLDTGEYIECKNLDFYSILPPQIPVVLESILTPDELLNAFRNHVLKFGSEDGVEDEMEHRALIVKAIFAWTRYHRVIYLAEDQLSDWKYGHLETCGLDLGRFSPLASPRREVFATYSAEEMQAFLRAYGGQQEDPSGNRR